MAAKLRIGNDNDPRLRWAAAIGLTHLSWRNTELENWHARKKGPDDYDMFQANVHTTRANFQSDILALHSQTLAGKIALRRGQLAVTSVQKGLELSVLNHVWDC